MLAIITASLIVMLASLTGIIFTWSILGNFIKKNIGLLVSFSAGVFLILIISLSSEVFEHAHNFTEPIAWIICGALGVLLLFKLLPNFHHHHIEEYEDHPHSKLDVRKIVISDSIHNVADGILLAASFAISIPIGIIATVSILVHEVVQEISEFFVLKQAGLATKKALFVNFISSGTILVGAIGGFFVLDTFKELEVPLLALTIGAFLVVIIQDIIPESVRHSHKKKNYLQHILFFLIGIGIMFSVNNIFSHAHEYGDDHGHSDHEHHDGEHLDEHHGEDEHHTDDHHEDEYHDENH